MEPAQAADTSKAKDFFDPSLCWRKAAHAGIGMSGEMVPTTMRSRSSARVPASSSARTAAFSAMSEVFSPGAATCRCRMPVRSVIQASLVSTIFARSSLVSTFSGA